MSDCAHETFDALVDVNRLLATEEDPTPAGFSADVRIQCIACGEHAVFRGLPVGLDQRQPTISINGQELHVPFRLESDDPNTGLGLAGFAVRVQEGMPGANN